MNINVAMLHPNDYLGEYEEPEDEPMECPMCGSNNVTVREVYELGELAWCYTCKYSFRPEEA